MPQYRIELAKTGRAGCKDTVCKKEQVKINKGEIRFGSWVEIDGHGSWSWKHWGCVSGAQMLGMREECDQGDGDYDFDMVDGYDELNDEPEIQEKIRRCIKQAHIDPEDFKGDPEKNVPGAKGIRLTAKERKELEKAAAADDDDAPKKKATKKRARKADADSDDEPVTKKKKAPAKKKAAKKEESDDDVPVKAAPAKKRTVKKEESDDDAPIKAAPAKKRAAKKVKQESDDEEEVVKPTKGRKSKAAVKKEESESEEDKPAVKAERKSKTTARTRRR
ncbi:hypothetical protein Golomagni_06669 [Golovinomyces magnicellulatus]|nr:hypothetical protein Golomagni_06669 [Golovinomyces magnicellulatus]